MRLTLTLTLDAPPVYTHTQNRGRRPDSDRIVRHVPGFAGHCLGGYPLLLPVDPRAWQHADRPITDCQRCTAIVQRLTADA